MRCVWHYFCVVPLGVWLSAGLPLHEHSVRSARVGRQPQDRVDLVVMRLGPGGLAHVHGAAVAALHRRRHALLRGHHLAQRLSALVDMPGLEPQAQHVHEEVSQHADEQMPFHTALHLVEYRAQAQIGLQAAEH